MSAITLRTLQKQDELNKATAGENWLSGVTKEGRKINWERCIAMESAEAIDSYPWKHWKSLDAKPDLDNISLELVDIWHFIQSLLLEKRHTATGKVGEELYEDVENFVRGFSLPGVFPRLQNIEAQISLFEDLMFYALETARNPLMVEESLENLFSAFYTLSVTFFNRFENIDSLYLGKYVLNSFRQDHGYKDGTYIKKGWVVDGEKVEDNVAMMRLLLTGVRPEDLYEELEKEYSKIVG